MDDFGDFPEDTKPAATTGNKTSVPEGLHTLKVMKFEETDSGYKATLAHEDRGFFWVNCWFNRNAFGKALLTQFREALGLNANEWKLSSPASIEGQFVRCDIEHTPGKQEGRVFANVKQFIAAPDEPAWEKDDRKPAARTAQQKAVAAGQGGADDDIPF